MPIKDILLNLDTGPGTPSRRDVAGDLAVRFDAHLVGLYISPPADMSGFAMSGGDGIPVSVIQQVLEEHAASQRRVAESLREPFEEMARRLAISAEWRLVDGNPTATLPEHARYADLVLLGQRTREQRDDPWSIAPEEVSLQCGGPVLVIPHGGRPASLGKRVLVAWNGSREAARAVSDAMPFLLAADQVTVLGIQEDDESALPRVMDLGTHLSRHGVEVTAETAVAGSSGPADLLMSRAFDLGADLLVMGAYGHSRLREMVLGGATRQIGREMTLPVLLSH